MNNANPVTDALATGDVTDDVFSVTVSDGATSASKAVTFSISGRDDSHPTYATQTIIHGDYVIDATQHLVLTPLYNSLFMLESTLQARNPTLTIAGSVEIDTTKLGFGATAIEDNSILDPVASFIRITPTGSLVINDNAPNTDAYGYVDSSYSAASFINEGVFRIAAQNFGLGVMFHGGRPGLQFNNSGDFEVSSPNRALGFIATTGSFANSGTFKVSGQDAVGVQLSSYYYPSPLINSGDISVISPAGGTSTAILFSGFYDPAHPMVIDNTGSISAKIAIEEITTFTPNQAPAVQLENSGAITGDILLADSQYLVPGPTHRIHNTGSITGAIQFGASNAFYDGAQGTQSGGIFLGVGTNTVIFGDDGERVVGAAGADTITLGAGNDTADGGAGRDLVSFARAGAGVTVSLAVSGPQATLGAGTDTLSGFEDLTGSAFADTLSGDGVGNLLSGGAGNDTAVFSGLRADYAISTSAGVTTVTDLGSGFAEGSDALTNVEHFRFADQTVDPNRDPIPISDSLTTRPDKTLVVSAASLMANDGDPDGDVLTLISVGGPQHGVVSLAAGQVTFAPDPGYTGPAGFDYTVSDGRGGVATAHVNVDVFIPPPGVVASAPTAGLVEAGDAGPGVSAASVSLVRTGGAGPVTYDLTGWTAQGAGLFRHAGAYGTAVLDTVHDQLSYTLGNAKASTNALSDGQAVADAFTLTVTDGVTAASQSVAFAIMGANDSPTARSFHTTGVYAAPLVLSSATLLANVSDPEGDALTLTAVGSAQHGTVSLNGGQVTFTPYAGFVGFARFAYTASDGHGGLTTGFVGVNVPSAGGNALGPTYINLAAALAGQTIDVSGDGQAHMVIGGAFNDFMYGGSKDDTLNGGGGADLISGGAGKDLITGGVGSDVLQGGAGRDTFIWNVGDVTGSPAGTQDAIYDFEGAGDGSASGDTLTFFGFSAGSSLTLQNQSSVNAHLYYYTLTDQASGASQLIAVNSLTGQPLAAGDYLFM